MSEARRQRSERRQLGQWMTPGYCAREMVDDLVLRADSRVLEPCFGDGAFLLPLIERLLRLHSGSPAERLARVLGENIWAAEIDEELYQQGLERIAARFGPLPDRHNLRLGDFFRESWPDGFDVVIGNPPFGGSFDIALEDDLDRRLGKRGGHKIKKETYSFFLVACLDLLREGGRLDFIVSDTFLTISTMQGLRRLLTSQGVARVHVLEAAFRETNYPMVILRFQKQIGGGLVDIDGERLVTEQMERTPNFSWRIPSDLIDCFSGPLVGDYLVASSGMTTGKNEYFLRPLSQDNGFVEPYRFVFEQEAISLADERRRARLGKLSAQQEERVRRQVAAGERRRVVRVLERPRPLARSWPDPDYRPYNKASGHLLYSPPTHVIYWKDDGDAVLSYKRQGPWYLRGVGGQPYFGREGITWQLIAPRIQARYLPPGYILDSGAPAAFLRDGVDHDELFFLLAWLLSDLATRLVKEVLNHTRNIQSKDIERLPYPHWVSAARKRQIIGRVKELLDEAQAGRQFVRDDAELRQLSELFERR